MLSRVRFLVLIAGAAMTAACASPPVVIDLAPTAEGVRVEYRVREADGADRLSGLIGSSSSLTVERDGSDARRFSVEAPRGARRYMYPLAANTGGDDWFIYTPALLPECLGQQAVRIGLAGGAHRDVRCPPHAYLVVRGDGDASRNTLFPKDDAVGRALEIAAAQALGRLSERLGPSPAPSRIIGVAISPDAPAGIVAHVDREGAVLFEVKPSFGGALDADVLRIQVRPLLRHELFHRWNAARVAPADDVPGWFYEGAAEYTGGLMSLEEGDFAPLEYNWVLGSMLNRCRAAVGDDGLAPDRRGRVYDYDCGAVSSWLLDLDLRRQGADHYAFWRALVLRAARSETGLYGWADVEAVLHNGGWTAPTWRLFINGSTAERLAQAIHAAGAEVVHEGSASDYRIALLQPLLAANCSSSSYGFFDEPGGVSLDVDTVCPALPSQARISSIEGIDLVADAAGAYNAARQACDESKVLAAVANGGPVELRCATLPEPTASFQVVNAGFSKVGDDPL